MRKTGRFLWLCGPKSTDAIMGNVPSGGLQIPCAPTRRRLAEMSSNFARISDCEALGTRLAIENPAKGELGRFISLRKKSYNMNGGSGDLDKPGKGKGRLYVSTYFGIKLACLRSGKHGIEM
jgi:hypothetical protein